MLAPVPSVWLSLPKGFEVGRVDIQTASLTCFLRCKGRRACCPLCGRSSSRIHSHYERVLAEVPVSGKPLALHLRVRRFFCDNRACSRRIFAERLPQLASPRQRRTVRLVEWGYKIAQALGGNAGARLCFGLQMAVSASTLLRQLRRSPASSSTKLTAIGIDDWAFKKGRTYGTIVVDLCTGKTIDLLPDREKDTVIAWLKQHPEIEIVSRDRNASYAEAVSTSAPQARQVADRWHLLRNLAEVLERLLLQHRSCLQEQDPPPAQEPQASQPPAPASADSQLPPIAPRPLSGEERERQARRQHKQECFAQVKALASNGVSQRAIARQMGYTRTTIRNWLGADAPPQRPNRSTVQQEQHDFVRQRWAEGCTDLKAIHAQLQQQGSSVSYSALYRAVRHLRRPNTTATLSPSKTCVSPRSAACRLLVLPDKRDPRDERLRTRIVSASETLTKAVDLADRFAAMVRKRQQEAFAVWIQDCQQSGIAEFVGFARSLLQDKSAVEAALSTEWSNAAAEGNVNRLKLLKRQMYGRASFALLRARVLHYP